jgi:hypothetical protein
MVGSFLVRDVVPRREAVGPGYSGKAARVKVAKLRGRCFGMRFQALFITFPADERLEWRGGSGGNLLRCVRGMVRFGWGSGVIGV